jgi:hypothetical protein
LSGQRILILLRFSQCFHIEPIDQRIQLTDRLDAFAGRQWATPDGVPYNNPDDWGLGGLREIEVAERVWRLE